MQSIKQFFSHGPVAAGLAMFAMFFGAGNLIFPLQVGQIAGDHNSYAILGLLVTAVVMPVAGLMAMVLFKSDYKAFFYRIGQIPGFSLIVLSMVIIGPLVALPRCVTLAYSIFEYSFSQVNQLWLFSLIACVITYLFALYRTKIVDILGYVLTPILLLFLLFMIGKGLWNATDPGPASVENFEAFKHGFMEGYNTLDLIAALFFSTIVFARIQELAPKGLENNNRYLVSTMLKASLIGGGLLALIYIGMSYAISYNHAHESIAIAEPDQLIAAIAFAILGENAGLISAIIAALACLTTAISLAVIFADFLRKDVCRNKISFHPSLVITIVLTFIMSLLGFSGIVAIAKPLIVLAYPMYIVLSLTNIAYVLYGFQWVKTPVAIALGFSLVVNS